MDGMLREKYIFYEEIGRGGSGKVFKAYDRHLQCLVAVKRFRAEDRISEKELSMLKELRHPVFPAVLDFMEDREYKYLVMEYIEGRDLEDYIRENAAVDQEQAVEWALELAEVLTELHERKCPVIYRDMKPANIMIDEKNHVRLVDFGTALLRYQEGDEACAGGTWGYAAPEQFVKGGGSMVDERSDVYGLGTTLFHMLTGCDPSKPPFLMLPVRFYDRKLSAGLERIIRKATEREKEKRYASVRRMKQDLENYRRSDRVRAYAETGIKAVYGIALAGLMLLFLWLWVGLEGQEIYGQRVTAAGSGRNLWKTLAEKEFLFIAACIFMLCFGREVISRLRCRGCRGIRQEKNVLLTVKKGKGLAAALLIAVWAAGITAGENAWAMDGGEHIGTGTEEENTLFVIVRNGQGQKLLIRYDAEYKLSETLRLELPLEDFEEGEHYELRLECVNRDSGAAQSRILLFAPQEQ